ncbi:hypothetical protein LTR65_000982 [Meristemomyces frigidus]
MAATAGLFAITELVEATLSFVEPRELLLIQAMSRKFKDVVPGSRKLQQSLFLAPTTGNALTRIFKAVGTEMQQELVENPFLCILLGKEMNGYEIDTGMGKVNVSIVSGVELGELIDKVVDAQLSGMEKGSYYMSIISRDMWRSRQGTGMLEEALGRMSGRMRATRFTGSSGEWRMKHFGPY